MKKRQSKKTACRECGFKWLDYSKISLNPCLTCKMDYDLLNAWIKWSKLIKK